MKYILLFTVAVFSLQSLPAANKYSDVRNVFKHWTEINNRFLAEAKMAKNAEAAAKALNRYTDEMSKFQGKFEKIEEKYPEVFKDTESAGGDPEADELKLKLLEIDKILKDNVIDEFIVSYDEIIKVINEFVIKYDTDDAFMDAMDRMP